jgi:phosphatidylserine/phosphatidylglycerophosphate/cardiolipin synthase-like enzyme
MLNKKIIILINAFLVFNNYLYASQDNYQKPEIVVEQIPPIVKDRLAIAYFGGREINNLIASAFMHEKKDARMSIYDAHYSINSGNSLNPILKALACLKENGTKIDIRSIVDSENITKPDFLQFSNYLKFLGCQVKKLNKDPGVLDSGNICLDPKSFLHQKLYLFKSCYQDGPFAIITSHNPTAHGATNYQKNNAIVIALPAEITELRKRFNLLYKKVAINLDNSLAVSLNPKIKEFKSTELIKLDDLNLQKNNNSSDNGSSDNYVQLSKSPLFSSHKSDSKNLISEKIIEQIRNESECIQLANFQFSHAGIALALADALARGVRVECLIDIGCVTNGTNSKKANQLAVTILNEAIVNNNNNGFIKFVGEAPSSSDTFRSGPILHNKFFTFKNSESVTTGSFNCSGNSDIYGIELGIKVKEQELLKQYNQEFKNLVKNSSSLPLEEFPLLENHKEEISKYSYKINGWAVDESGNLVYKSFVDSK